jgi:hypothetical protein
MTCVECHNFRKLPIVAGRGICVACYNKKQFMKSGEYICYLCSQTCLQVHEMSICGQCYKFFNDKIIKKICKGKSLNVVSKKLKMTQQLRGKVFSDNLDILQKINNDENLYRYMTDIPREVIKYIDSGKVSEKKLRYLLGLS